MNMSVGTSVPSRPKYYHQSVRELAAESILNEVSKWLNENSQFVEENLKEALVSCIDHNAFDFARALEDRYDWSPDARLVEILDKLSLFSASQQAVEAWVKAHDVKIPFNIGDRVSAPAIKAGTVRELRPKTAQIVVEADGDAMPSRNGAIINFEDAILIIGTVGEAAPAEGGAA